MPHSPPVRLTAKVTFLNAKLKKIHYSSLRFIQDEHPVSLAEGDVRGLSGLVVEDPHDNFLATTGKFTHLQFMFSLHPDVVALLIALPRPVALRHIVVAQRLSFYSWGSRI
jgi:hypothetical protein